MPLTRLNSPEAAARWLKEWVRGTLTTDSRRVRPGDAFVAWPGHTQDGRRFVADALVAGAATCLVEADGVEAFGFIDARIAALPRMKEAVGRIADAFFERPSETIDVIAVTGTNGKSSTAWWTAQALAALGRRSAVVGTLGLGEPPSAGTPAGTVASTGLTTPDPVVLQAALRDFADRRFAAAAVEASSIGIVEHRLAGVRVKVALFTNFTRDHLDYHGSMEQYWLAKRALFEWHGLAAAGVNLDDPRGVELAAELGRGAIASSGGLWTYGVAESARLRAVDLRYLDGGLAFELREGEAGAPVRSRLVGDYNASNLLAVCCALRALGVSLEEAASVMPRLTPVPGRMQRVDAAAAFQAPARPMPGTAADRPRTPPGGPEVIVDYAHTPDALEKALAALRPLAAARGGSLWCVFGCGGSRDATKRPLMGAIARRLADRLVLTSDNPRDENPALILAQILAGIAGPDDDVAVIEDRREAIAHAVTRAAPSDVIVVAGKGHETYQETAAERRAFSDVDEAAQALHARRAA